jgi:amidase
VPIHQQTATEIVTALRSGQLTAEAVIEQQTRRIQRLNGDINAIVAIVTIDGKTNANIDGPLAGLPVTLKDQIHFTGLPCTFGFKPLRSFQPKTNAPIVDRLIEAGANILGKTNLPPFAMDFQCSNDLFGATNNPWNAEYTSGGSSGGGASAIATGMSFLEMGTDLSGSLRIPASFCGVFSLLPSEGALPVEGMMPDGLAPLKHFARPGPIARNTGDLKLAWRVLSGKEEDDQQANPDSIKIIWSKESGGVPLCGRISDQIDKAISLWQRNDINISSAHPAGFDFKQARRAFGEIMGYETGGLLTTLQRMIARLFSRGAAKRSPEFIANVMRGYRRDKKQYEKALQEKQQLSKAIDDFLGDEGFWLLPVTATSVFKHMKPTRDHMGNRDYAEPLMINGQAVNYFDALTAYVTPVSLTGHPVVTIPLGLDQEGFPAGAQLVGRKGKEYELLSAAERLCGYLHVPPCPLFLKD